MLGVGGESSPYSGLAGAIAAGGTVVWCERPALNGTAAVNESIELSGWAYSGAGLDSIVVTFGGRRFEPRLGLRRPDVDAALQCLGVHVSGFSLEIDVRGWAPGSYELAVYAIGVAGHAAAQTGRIEIGSEARYRVWLRTRQLQALTAGGSSLTSLRVGVVPVTGHGRVLMASLEQQTDVSFGRVEGSILELLHALAAGGPPLVLVEDRGALAPGALARIAAAISGGGPPDLVYADEDALLDDGGRGAAFLKPGWSPELLLSFDYVGPLVAVGATAARAALEAGVGSPRTIYELLLSLVDEQLHVERIPEVLFTSQTSRIPDNGARVTGAIRRIAARRGRPAEIRPLLTPEGSRDVRFRLDAGPLVSIIIPTRMSDGVVSRCLQSLATRTSYGRFEIVVVYSGSDRPPVAPADIEYRVVPYRGEFNFSTAINMGAREAAGDYLLLLNDDTEIWSADWLERMLEHALVRGVGIVGCKLLYPHGRIQHAGVFIDTQRVGAWHPHIGLPADSPGYRGLLGVTRNLSAVTGACMVISSQLFAELDGLDEGYSRDFGDIDICLRAIERGLRVVWTPFAVLTHRERSSFPQSVNADDRDRFIARWASRYGDGDPFYHPAFRTFSPEFPYSYELRLDDEPAAVPYGRREATKA